jgi:hypothetical protein
MWMVIGERHDPHMKNVCGMADDHGRVVVEYDQPEPMEEPQLIEPDNEPDPLN